MTRIKELENKKLKKINWGLIFGWVIYTVSVRYIFSPNLAWLGFISLFYLILWIINVFWFWIGFQSSIIKRMQKFQQTLTAKTWIKVGDSAIMEVYVFDLTNGYLYGLFQLNPFYIQKMDLKDVEDVKIVVNYFRDSTTHIRCRIIHKSGKINIYIRQDSRYSTLLTGSAKELAYLEEAEKLKKLILDLKEVAQVRDQQLSL